jgi:hypothetical protein
VNHLIYVKSMKKNFFLIIFSFNYLYRVLTHNPFHQHGLFIYIALLYEMKDKTGL